MAWLERCKDSSFYVIFVYPGISLLQRTFSKESLTTAGALSTLLMVSYLFVSYGQAQPGDQLNITPEHIALFNIQDSGVQSAGYQVFVALVFLFSVLRSFFADPASEASSISRQGRASCVLDTLIVAFALFLVFFFFSYYDKTLRTSFWFCVLFLALELFRNSRPVVSGMFAVVLTVLVVFYIMPLFTTYLFEHGLWFFDHHWAGLVGPGLFGAIGEVNGRASFPEYGFFFNAISTALASEKSLAAISDVLTVYQSASLLFTALLLGVVWQRASPDGYGAVTQGTLFLLLIFTPILSGYSSHFETPNQLPIRYFFIAVVVVFSFYVPKLPVLLAWFCSGALCLVAVLYNLEVGLVCCLGFGFALFVWTVKQGVLRLILGGVAFGAGTVLSALLVHVAVLVPFGLTLFRILQANLELLALFGAGYGGVAAFWYPPFFLALAHCVYLFSVRLQRMRSDSLSGLEFQTVVLVGLMIAFTPYVMNRFAVQNMWVPFLLYLLLLLPWMFSGASRARRLLTVVFALVFAFPFQYGPVRSWSSMVSDKVEFEAVGKCNERARLTPDLCNYVVEKAEALNSLLQEGNTAWISALPLTTNLLAELPSALSKLDPFAYARTDGTQAELVRELKQGDADVILIDNPDNAGLSQIPQAIFDWQKRFVEEAGFVPVKTTPYWILAEREKQ